MGLTGRWPDLAMGHLVMGLTWLVPGWMDCLQADNHDRSCRIFQLLCQFPTTILLTAISASCWQFLDVLHGPGRVLEVSTWLVWQSWYLEGSTFQSHTAHCILVCTAYAGHLSSFHSLCTDAIRQILCLLMRLLQFHVLSLLEEWQLLRRIWQIHLRLCEQMKIPLACFIEVNAITDQQCSALQVSI